MGSSESIHNDTTSTVEVWFQSPDEGLCPKNRCMDTTLPPGSTTGKQEFALSLAHQVCVQYLGPDGTSTVCKEVTSPQLAGQRVTYNVGDIMSNASLVPETNPFVIIIPACILAAFILTSFLFKKFCRSAKPEQGLEEKLIEEGSNEGSNQKEGSPTTLRPPKLKPRPPGAPQPAGKGTSRSAREVMSGNLKIVLGAKPNMIYYTKASYQDLVCFKCFLNVPGQMTICQNIDESTNKMFTSCGRDGYTALCPVHARAVGSSNWHSVVAKFEGA